MFLNFELLDNPHLSLKELILICYKMKLSALTTKLNSYVGLVQMAINVRIKNLEKTYWWLANY